MSNRNQINSNFQQIAEVDANLNVVGINTASVTTDSITTQNLLVGSAASLAIGGGTEGEFLRNNGNNDTQWALPDIRIINNTVSTGVNVTGQVFPIGATSVIVTTINNSLFPIGQQVSFGDSTPGMDDLYVVDGVTYNITSTTALIATVVSATMLSCVGSPVFSVSDNVVSTDNTTYYTITNVTYDGTNTTYTLNRPGTFMSGTNLALSDGTISLSLSRPLTSAVDPGTLVYTSSTSLTNALIEGFGVSLATDNKVTEVSRNYTQYKHDTYVLDPDGGFGNRIFDDDNTIIRPWVATSPNSTGINPVGFIFINQSGQTRLVQITLQVCWDQNATGARVQWINWTNLAGTFSQRVAISNMQASPNFTGMTTTAIIPLADDDIIQPFVWQNSGSTTNIGSYGGGQTLLTFTLL